MTSSGIVADIKSRLPIVELVGETVALKRAGSAYKGLCPFHAEKTPSFIVTPDRESWHCFGCGKGGDAFTFLMERDGVDFREALTRLAEKAGVELSAQSAREDRRRRRLREALEAAIAWYREVLLRTPQGERARAYLRERGFTDETLDRFSIGYAPNLWDPLSKRLGARGFSDEELVSAGLAGPSNRGGIIDKFRGRIIIPIRDQSGKAVGLGGRILPGLEGPKYLNSPSTPLFDKSRTLFAIDLAKSSIRKEKLSVIVEGYTDVMAAHQAGFTNVVASLGTALTRGQVELATRYADAVALAYDVDLAGEAATQRGLLEELGPDAAVSKVRVIRIPAGKDPDELIRTDPDAWRRAIADAKPVIEYFIDRAATEADLSTIAGRRDVTGRSLAILKRVGDRVERALYLQHLARLVNVEERTLGEALERAPVIRRSPRPGRMPGNGSGAPSPSLGTLESEALELMLRYPTLATELPVDEMLPFAGAVARQLASALRERAATMSQGDGQADQGAALEAFVGGLDPATGAVARELLEAAALDSGEPALDPVEAREVLRTCLLRLRVERLDEALRDGRLLLEEAQRERDHGRLEEIEQRIDRLGREKADATRAMHTPATSLA
ncbi:MAG: DNA primase [Chloroflexi bacterium]|nr:MAG: DNA primase [Chloroflexota bacterium]